MENNKIEGGAIQCPHCKELIPITASLHTQLAEVLKEGALQEAKKEYDAELFENKKKWEVEAKEKAKAEVSLELKDLREQAAENKNKIEQYQEKELALLRKNRDLEEREKNVALEIARQVAAESRLIEDKIEFLQEGLFTPDEKKSLFDTVKLVNDRLADNVVGRMDITLTRLEYDMLMESVRLPNRFLKPEMIEVE
jgi:hypothetical protein